MATFSRILTERGEAQRIASIFNVSPQTVRNALRFITEGEQPDRIREEALKGGGKITKRPLKQTAK